MTRAEAEMLLETIKIELKQDGFSEKTAEEILEMSSVLLLEWIIQGAPITDDRFIAGLEVLIRTLKVLRANRNANTDSKNIN